MFSRRFVEALDSIYGDKLPVVSMNDRHEDFPSEFLKDRETHGCGHLHRTLGKLCAVRAINRSRQRPAVFSTHPYATKWLMLDKRLNSRPYLTVAHGVDVWQLESPALRRGLINADLVLPVSNFTRRKIREQLSHAAPRMETFSNTIDPTAFYPAPPDTPWRNRLNINGDDLVLLTVTRLDKTEKRKGYDLIIDSLPDLLKVHPNLVWILAGKGEDSRRIQDRADQMGIAENCRFPGFIAEDELADLYRSSNVFVLPSQKEGFGIVFLEATACGVPAIGGNIDGSVDALANGALGTLIDPNSSSELKEAILRIAEQSSQCQDSLHTACVERFGLEAFKSKLHDILLRHPTLSGPALPK